MKVAVVGVTGMVGSVMLEVLKELDFPVTELLPVASEKSVGKSITFRDKKYKIISLSDAVSKRPKIALFSAGGSVSMDWAPKFAEVGTTVVDNSSAWRMDPKKKLVVPEINAHVLTKKDKIIANPNCSTIQMVMALAPLHKKYQIRRIVVSTYQSVSGTGIKAVQQLESEAKGLNCEKAYPHQIYKNALPHCDTFLENRYTKEEMKLCKEPLKILEDDSIKITATAVRVPVEGGHSESINIEFENDFSLENIQKILESTPGISVVDSPENNLYPLCIDAQGKNDVFVGRIRRDESQEKTLNLWLVADNLRKGAATNTIQIAQYLIDENLV